MIDDASKLSAYTPYLPPSKGVILARSSRRHMDYCAPIMHLVTNAVDASDLSQGSTLDCHVFERGWKIRMWTFGHLEVYMARVYPSLKSNGQGWIGYTQIEIWWLQSRRGGTMGNLSSFCKARLLSHALQETPFETSGSWLKILVHAMRRSSP